MKKTLSILLVFALLFSACAVAEDALTPGEEIYLYDDITLYDAFHRSVRSPICVIPGGSVVIYLGPISWGFFVVYENHAGFIESPRYRRTYSWECFDMPNGTSATFTPSLPSWGDVTPTPDPHVPIPQFPYQPVACTAFDRFSMRSGPSTDYLWITRFPKDLNYTVFYQAKGNGYMWGLFEFTYDNAKYRLFTTTDRLTDSSFIPTDNEIFYPATITKSHSSYFGPGYDYAATGYTVPAGTEVQALYQENGWLFYNYQIPGDRILRCWAPAGCWE